MDLVKETLNVINLFKNCDKCGDICNKRNKKSDCCHFYCDTCISSLEFCVKCALKFHSNNSYIDNNSDVIINKLEALLEQTENTESSLNTSSVKTFVPNSEITKVDILSNTDSSLTDYVDSECDCTNYLEVDYKSKNDDLLNKKNKVGETKLFRVCKKGNIREVEKLLEAGASVNIQDNAGWAPLHEAVLSENLQLTERLLEFGSVVNVPGDNYVTPLHKAAVLNNPKMAELLIKYGANKDLRNYEGYTPLDIALPNVKKVLTDTKLGRKIFKLPQSVQKYTIVVLQEITDKAKKIINEFSKKVTLKLTLNINENVTHIIVNQSSKIVEPSYAFLQAIVLNIPVITIEWLEACNLLNKIIDYNDYLVIGTAKYPCNIISRSQMHKHKLEPRLFNGLNFYLTPAPETQTYQLSENVNLTRNEMVKLLMAAGGNILKREPHLTTITSNTKKFPWHAKTCLIEECCYFIIYVPSSTCSRQEIKYNMKELKHIPYTWVFKCIFQYKLLPVVPDSI